jgi:CheY-like chemotaxis protein
MVTVRQRPHKRILLVEDNFSTRELMSMILGAVGYQVSTAAHGEEALQHIQTFGSPDLILLDLRMPVMDGWQLREQLSQDPALAAIPVVFLSGSDAGDPTALLAAGLFLRKPVETAELLRTVEQCCG